jgi:hypothetical protein
LKRRERQGDVTPAQRAYLRAFDDWLHHPTSHNLTRRRIALELLFAEADYTPPPDWSWPTPRPTRPL